MRCARCFFLRAGSRSGVAEREGFEPSIRISTGNAGLYKGEGTSRNIIDEGQYHDQCYDFMASIHKDSRGKSPYWYCAFTLPGGQRAFRSTKERDRRRAQDICRKWELATDEAQRGRLTESAARKVIADIYELANKERLPSSTVEGFFETWLAGKRNEIQPSSYQTYVEVVAGFLGHIGDRRSFDIGRIGKADFAAYRDAFVKRGLSPGTANKGLKIIRSAFTQAQRDGIISENPAMLLKGVKKDRGGDRRRAFTLPELEQILAVANDEWRGIILTGLYTGQRLGDIADLTWANVDLSRGELRLVTQKTERQQILPLAQPLARLFENLPSSDDPKQPLFPKAFDIKARTGRVGMLSNQFFAIMASAGLVKSRSHQKHGEGRDTKRKASELCFHCLRHTATSLLKNAGISPAIVQEFVGHDSKAVSQNYTHIETAAMRKAADSLPDLTLKLSRKNPVNSSGSLTGRPPRDTRKVTNEKS